MDDSNFNLPPAISGPSAWYGPEMAGSGEWLYRLSEAEIGEVDLAMRKVAMRTAAGAALEVAAMGPDDFPLPTLGPRLQQLLDDVLNWRGFVLIRGLPIGRWTRREAAIAYLGIGRHLGSMRSQNAQGHILGHVRDAGLSSQDPNVRIYQTHERQTYHTDSCDVVALLCLQPAMSGGLSSLVSSVTIHNEMQRRRPDLLEALFEPIETDRRGEVPAGQKPYFSIPVFNWHAGLLSAIYQRQYIESARRFPEVQLLTARQISALDLFDELANDPTLGMQMEFQAGDIQLVHNHTILHDRTSFEDWPETERKRHLLRLWLAPAGARALPEVYAERFGSVTAGDRGGVVVEGTTPTVPLSELTGTSC
jgi:hypothetical protein